MAIKRRYEYLSVFVQAEAERVMDFLLDYRDWKNGVPRNTPESLMPQLNALGEDGWDLMHIQPVVVGKNADVALFDSNNTTRNWTSSYFCVFKREKE